MIWKRCRLFKDLSDQPKIKVLLRAHVAMALVHAFKYTSIYVIFERGRRGGQVISLTHESAYMTCNDNAP